MNRSIIALSLLFSLVLVAPAYALSNDSSNDIVDGANAGVQASFQDKVNSQKELNAAIRHRQIRYLLELRRGHDDRGSKLAQHQFNLYRNNVDTTSTILSRSGELTDYEGRRPASDLSTMAPNNSKRNFRVRAIDYYVENGDAGKEVLEENVTLGSQHRVARTYFNKQLGGQAGYADLVESIRQLQKSKYAKANEDSVLNPFSQSYGASERNFIHPFMKFLE